MDLNGLRGCSGFKNFRDHFKTQQLVKFLEKESRMVVTRVWKEEEMGNCLMGVEFQCYKIKRVLEICYKTM